MQCSAEFNCALHSILPFLIILICREENSSQADVQRAASTKKNATTKISLIKLKN